MAHLWFSDQVRCAFRAATKDPCSKSDHSEPRNFLHCLYSMCRDTSVRLSASMCQGTQKPHHPSTFRFAHLHQPAHWGTPSHQLTAWRTRDPYTLSGNQCRQYYYYRTSCYAKTILEHLVSVLSYVRAKLEKCRVYDVGKHKQ